MGHGGPYLGKEWEVVPVFKGVWDVRVKGERSMSSVVVQFSGEEGEKLARLFCAAQGLVASVETLTDPLRDEECSLCRGKGNREIDACIDCGGAGRVVRGFIHYDDLCTARQLLKAVR